MQSGQHFLDCEQEGVLMAAAGVLVALPQRTANYTARLSEQARVKVILEIDSGLKLLDGLERLRLSPGWASFPENGKIQLRFSHQWESCGPAR